MIVTPKILIATLGERIRAYRVAQGLTQKELGKLTEIDPRSISELENDKRPFPSVWRVWRIARALGVTTAHLTGEVDFLAEWPEPSNGVPEEATSYD